MRRNSSGVGSGVSLMKGRVGIGQLVNESEGGGLWGRDGITLRRFSGGGRGRSGHRQDEWGGCKAIYQSHVRLLIHISFYHRQGPIYRPEEARQGEVAWRKGEDVVMKTMVMKKIQCVVDCRHKV